MTVNVVQVPQNNTSGESTDPIGYETTFDGQTFFWGPNQKRSFLDDGVATGHIGNATGSGPWVVEDNSSSARKYPGGESRA